VELGRDEGAVSETHSDLWTFALEVYSRPGVSEACLWLQDRRSLDVDMLLFALWHGVTRGELDASLLERADSFSRVWSSRVVRRLRALRRRLSAPERASVQRVELAAERVQLEALERLAGEACSSPEPHGDSRQALELYLGAARVSIDVEVETRLRVLLDAVS
jgi:uncharacterized protein (TIGR02444 family)